ncbi:MAG: histidine phosphatase family protein [Chloroflexota bacterium]
MTTLILIRHAPTRPNPSLSADQWQLTDASEVLCQQLAQEIKDYNVSKIYMSHEAKAIQTANYVALALGDIPTQIANDLHETERKTNKFYESQVKFRQAVMRAMQSPDELLFGDETFTDARQRFALAIKHLAKQHTDETIGIVSHGRVLSLYLWQIMNESPMTIWQHLKMPAFAVLAWKTQTINRIVYQLEDNP